MGESLAVVITLVIFAVPVVFLTLAIRHFIPLCRGIDAPLWVYALGPFAFAFDKYFPESARPHRKKFLLYITLFCVTCQTMLFVFGKA